MNANEKIIPLYKFDLVPLPGEVLSLHVLDQHYLAILHHDSNQNQGEEILFGVLNTAADSELNVGCVVRVLEAVEEVAKAAYSVSCLVEERFELVRRLGDSVYPNAVVVDYRDLATPVDQELLNRVSAKVLKTMSQVLPQDEYLVPRENKFSFYLARLLDLTASDRKLLLEEQSENVRIAAIELIVDSRSVEQDY